MCVLSLSPTLSLHALSPALNPFISINVLSHSLDKCLAVMTGKQKLGEAVVKRTAVNAAAL